MHKVNDSVQPRIERRFDTMKTAIPLSRHILIGFICLLSDLRADDWTRFRGPNGSGQAADKIPVKWSVENYKWKTKLPGIGHGSPVVQGNRVFLLAGDEDSGARMPLCVDAVKGRILWRHTLEAEKHRHHRQNTFASSTPTVDEQRVYFTWGTPKALTIIAYQHDGTKAWETDLGPVKGGHGFGASPILHGELLILNNDQDGESSLLALDRANGEVRWRIARDSRSLTYSTPCVYRDSEGRETLVFTNWHHGITGVDPATGKVLWENDVFGKPSSERAIGSPVTAGDLVIGSCGFVTKLKHVVALRPVPGRTEAKEIWRIERSVPHIPTPLIVDRWIYLWNDQGILTCADNRTGETLWNERAGGEGYSSAVCAGGHIYRVSVKGEVSVLPADGTFTILATNLLNEPCFATPAVAGGRIFIRTRDHLIAVAE